MPVGRVATHRAARWMGHLLGCVACHQSKCWLHGVGGAAAVLERVHEQLWFSELLQPSIS